MLYGIPSPDVFPISARVAAKDKMKEAVENSKIQEAVQIGITNGVKQVDNWDEIMAASTAFCIACDSFSAVVPSMSGRIPSRSVLKASAIVSSWKLSTLNSSPSIVYK